MCEWVCNECAKGVHSPVRFFQGETEGDTEGLRMGSKVKAGCGGVKGHEVTVRVHRESGVTPGREVMGSKVTWGAGVLPIGSECKGSQRS